MRAADLIAREYSVPGGPLEIIDKWPLNRILLTCAILEEGTKSAMSRLEDKGTTTDKIRKKRSAMEVKREQMFMRVRAENPELLGAK